MKYEFKSLKTGAWCCRTNDKKLLCAACFEQAIGHKRAVASPAAPVAAAANDVPSPPSLTDAVRTNRGLPPLAVAVAPPFPRPATVLAQHDGVEPPPSLADAIAQRRNRR